MINMVIATYWLTVFHLAMRDAGTITPTDAATARRPVTASSRPTMTTTIHASILSMASSDTSAAATRSLSAIGSRSVPRVVTWLRRRASIPSAQSVMAARMKIAAAISACTRDDEMRNTMSSGTATMRVRVRPIGKFTLELRRRNECASSLSGVAHDLVNVRHVARHEIRRVQAQAHVDIGGTSGGDEAARPRRVALEPADVGGVLAARVQGVPGGLGENGRGNRREDALDREPATRPVLERAAAMRARAHDGHGAPGRGGPRRGGGDVDERGDADRVGGARGEQRARPVARREIHRLAPHVRALELDGRVAEIETGNRLALPLAGDQGTPVARLGGPAPGILRIGNRHDRVATVRERGDDRRRRAEDVDPHGSGVAIAERANLEPERVQIDESLGVSLPIDRIGLERREVGPVE